MSKLEQEILKVLKAEKKPLSVGEICNSIEETRREKYFGPRLFRSFVVEPSFVGIHLVLSNLEKKGAVASEPVLLITPNLFRKPTKVYKLAS